MLRIAAHNPLLPHYRNGDALPALETVTGFGMVE